MKKNDVGTDTQNHPFTGKAVLDSTTENKTVPVEERAPLGVKVEKINKKGQKGKFNQDGSRARGHHHH